MKRSLVLFLAISSTSAFTGCGGGGYSTTSPANPLSISATAPPDGLVGAAFGAGGNGFALNASGGTPPYHWTLAAGASSTVPPGLSVVGSSIAGTPTAGGTYSVVVTATDSASPATAASRSFTIAVAASVLAITSATVPAGTVGINYGPGTTQTLQCRISFILGFHIVCTPCPIGASCNTLPICGLNIVTPCRKMQQAFNGFVLVATGGLPGYSWTLGTGAMLPPGLNVSSNGVITGKPTQPGTFTGSLVVSDTAIPPNQATLNFSIQVAPPAPPVVDAVATLPLGANGSPYAGFQFTASGSEPFTWSQTGTVPAGLAFSADGKLTGTPTATGTFVIAVTAHDPFKQSSKALNFTIQVLATGFVPAGSLTEARTLHADALLPGGKALLTGGINLTDAPVKGEVFDSASETFTATTGSMNTPRVSPTVTALANGKILIAGGKDATGNVSSSAELYDPASNTYTATSGSMTTERVYHTSTLLNDGTVLLTGGLDAAGNTTGVPVASAEIFDPATGKFTAVGNLAAGRFFQTATLVPAGEVLITGGIDASAAALASAELYDPSAKTFSTTAVNMNVNRAGHTATLLATGKVLVAGGAGSFSGQSAASAELYDPAAATFATTGTMITGRALCTATLLNDGQVLLAGGNSYFYNGELGFTLSATELFNPGTGTFTSAADMGNARESHTAILLSNGKVLVAGGSNGTLGYSTTTTVLATAELF